MPADRYRGRHETPLRYRIALPRGLTVPALTPDSPARTVLAALACAALGVSVLGCGQTRTLEAFCETVETQSDAVDEAVLEDDNATTLAAALTTMFEETAAAAPPQIREAAEAVRDEMRDVTLAIRGGADAETTMNSFFTTSTAGGQLDAFINEHCDA
ncbi:MAG: hypothetical protein Q4G67_12375 [Actinomycetia bacterium]|nr:hypothetical protein [Actinomycetes bacterium]